MSRPFLVIFLTIFVNLVGFGIIIPLLPFYAETFGASPLIIGLLFAVFSLCQLVAAPALVRSEVVPLRKLCIESPLIVVATPIDPLVPTKFRVTRVLRATGKARLGVGATVAPTGLDPARVRTSGELDPETKKAVPRAIEQALLFLEPGADGKSWKVRPYGFRFCAADGKLLAPMDETNTPALSTARWAILMRRVQEDVVTLAKLDDLRHGGGRTSRRVAGLLAWVEANRGDFATVSAGTDEAPTGWDRLQIDVFDWVFGLAGPEDAWKAVRLYAELNGGEAPQLQSPTFSTPEGRAVLVREIRDTKRLSADRVRAACLLSQPITAWPGIDEQRLGAKRLDAKEQETTLDQLAALLPEKDDALRTELAKTIARLSDPEGSPARRSTRALAALVAVYKDTQPGVPRDELALAICRLAPPTQWKDLTSNPPGVCAVLGEVERANNKLTFWLTLRSGGGTVHEAPTLIVERLGIFGFVAETKRTPFAVVNLDKGWAAGWTGADTLAAQVDLGNFIKPSTLYRVRVEGFVGKGKDRQKWLSEPQKFAVPAARPQPNRFDGLSSGDW